MVAIKAGVGRAIRALRERRSLTQIDLAERCRLSRGAIGQFERGLASPSLETLGRILEVLDANLMDLQRELDRQSGEPSARREDLIEIGGVKLGPDEVERRIEAAFDRLVRRSLRGETAALVPLTKSGVGVE